MKIYSELISYATTVMPVNFTRLNQSQVMMFSRVYEGQRYSRFETTKFNPPTKDS